MIKQWLNSILRYLGISDKARLFYRARVQKKDILFNVTRSEYDKQCLLIYITDPFLSDSERSYHQNTWQVKDLAQIIASYGYIVDVADWNNPYIKLHKKYDMVIGLIPRGIDIYSKNNMTDECIRIAYLTSSNLAYTNKAELKRIEDLYKRRGTRVLPRRQTPELTKELEEFDAAFFIGNEYNLKSYEGLRMPPVYFITNGEKRQYANIPYADKRANCFMFIGSVGQVHKGLDLLLEVFATERFPCELYIFSAYDSEMDFCKGYEKELFNTRNIHPMGFVDVDDTIFRSTASKCAYMIMPSCAEGMAGSVLTAMAYGMIPIVSKECGYDSDVVLLSDCEIETIKSCVLEYSAKPKEWVIDKAKEMQLLVRTKYSEKKYEDSVTEAFDKILGTERRKEN